MAGRGCQFAFFALRCSNYASQIHIFILGLILAYDATLSSQVQASSVRCRSTDISLKYQHCGIHPDGVHDLECFGKYNSLKKKCVWKPGKHTSEKIYTLIITQQKHDCSAHMNITDNSEEIKIFERYNMTAEVFENSESANCTRAVFRASPKDLLRCGPPWNVSFSRHSGGLDVNAIWSMVDTRLITNYTVRYKALGSPLWSASPARCQIRKQCRVENLNSSLVYSVQIQCVTGKCPQCVWSEVYNVSSELTAHPVIVNLQDTDIVGNKGSRLLILTWRFPAKELHEGFHVTVGKVSGEVPVEQMNTTQPEIRLILSYSSYHVNIRAVNNASTSPAVRQIIPQREDKRILGAGRLNVTVQRDTSFTIYWKDNLIKRYVCYCVEWMKKGHKAAYMSFHQDKNNYRTLSPLPEPLEPYKRYSITLHTRPDKDTCNMKRINNSESTYGITQFYFIEGSPVSAPTNISSYNVTSNSMVLQWSSIPEEDLRGFLLGYIIYYTEYDHRGTSTERNVTVDPALNRYKLGDLKSGTAYEVQISGFTRAGAGVRSTSGLFETHSQGYSHLGAVIIVFAVLATVLIFGHLIIKRAKVVLWPSIPNPGKSSVVQKIEGPCELERLKSIDTLTVEESDADSLQVLEREDVIPASTLPSVLPLLYASEDEEDSAEMTCNWIQRNTEGATGDILPEITAETFSDTKQAELQTPPCAFFSGYTTMEMFQQGKPQGVPANASVTQETKTDETDLTGVKPGLHYVRQFSTSPTSDSLEMPMSPFMRTVWNGPAEHDEPGTQDQNNYCP